jgi:hypothetical protein
MRQQRGKRRSRKKKKRRRRLQATKKTQKMPCLLRRMPWRRRSKKTNSTRMRWRRILVRQYICRSLFLTQRLLGVDISEATAKELIRLRRDDLVKLCENRNLAAEGTKQQLAKALITWREKQHSSSSPSAVSSTSTAKPTSGPARKAGRRKHSKKNPTPVLLRSDRILVETPHTPIPDSDVINDPGDAPIIHNSQQEPELELDLESLGLEDKEIPPHLITKLEKIGSGGFKE